MTSIFEFTNYRQYLTEWIEAQGPKTYGMKGRIAKSLEISSSLLSQILKGDKSLTSEQTSDLSDFLGLTELESDYLHLLVEYDRAGTPRYRQKLAKKLSTVKKRARDIGERLSQEGKLSDTQKAIYFSSWLYTGVRNLSAVSGVDGVDDLVQRLHEERSVVARIVSFLLENGLCREENGRLTFGPRSTHVDKDSPFVNKHHQNWRIQAVQKMERKNPNDLFFTSPLSLSHDAAEQIYKQLVTSIQELMEISDNSPSERVACLNIDWFEY